MTLPDGTLIEYVHDPLGRRIAKRINGTIVEKYLWQGMTRLLAVYDGANNLLMRFEYADDRMPVALTAGGATYYLAYDQVGSLRVVADAAGVVIKRIDYDSFGNIIADTNPAFGLPFGFAGGLHDRDTGLVRFGHRDYDPDVGRWTAKDPIFFAGGDTDLYGYVLNDPMNLIDPLGLVFRGTELAIKAVMNNPNLSAQQKIDIISGLPDNIPDPNMNNPYMTHEFDVSEFPAEEFKDNVLVPLDEMVRSVPPGQGSGYPPADILLNLYQILRELYEKSKDPCD